MHINTQKGKGYKIAEENKENWHWCMPFDAKTRKSNFLFEGENYETLTAKTIRYYEKIGLIPAVPRTKKGETSNMNNKKIIVYFSINKWIKLL